MNARSVHGKIPVQFARQLGWDGLVRHEHSVRPPDVECPEQVVWFESGSMDDILLQINTSPAMHAAVYAPRYRICTGWHAIGSLTTPADAAREAARLEPWLARHWFTTRPDRRRFRLIHPECNGYTLRRLRECGSPHKFEPLTR